MPYDYEFPRPALTVDCVVFGLDEEDLKVALIQRDLEPFAGKWALPGGFVHIDESLEEAARRELQEEAGLSKVFLEQLYSFGDLKRDPRERIVTVAYFALVNIRDHRVQAATDARNAAWFAVSDTPSLAFDHEKILHAALERLKGKVRYQPIGFELLPAKFTLTELQHLYQTILERELDKRNFRRKVLAMGFLEETDEIEQDVAHRAARLYRFNETKYRKLVKQGFLFELQAEIDMKALVIVDVQNDFCAGGALAVPEGDQVVEIINRLQPEFDLVVATQDWHPAGHSSFAANHPGRRVGEQIELGGLPQILWPVHCVQGTAGAELHSKLNRSRIARVFQKGTDPGIDSYSGFFDNGHRHATGLGDYLKKQCVTEVYVCGLATDYCVKFTALDAVGLGFKTHLLERACRGVELQPGDVRRAVEEMRRQGVKVIDETIKNDRQSEAAP